MATGGANDSNGRVDTLLVRINGPDHPGITAGLMGLLDTAGAGVEDVEQIIIRGRLSLSLVVTVPSGRDLVKEMLHYGWEQGIDIDFEIIDAPPSVRQPKLVVTILGHQVTPAEFGALASSIAKSGGNIDRIVRLARTPVLAYELVVSGEDRESIRAGLLQTADTLRCDVAVHREGLGRRATRLVVLDVDSTLIREEVIELVADEAGCREQVAEITERAMRGELDFESSLHERVALFEGLPVEMLDRVIERIELTPGARTFIRTLKRLGYRTAIVSGGFTLATQALAEQLDIDHAFANTLEVHEGKLTGRVTGMIVDRKGKADLVRKIAELENIPLDQVVAIGDGANDLDMLNAAGLGIAFNAKPVVQEHADTTLNVPYLDAILFVLGVRRTDIENADAATGTGA